MLLQAWRFLTGGSTYALRDSGGTSRMFRMSERAWRDELRLVFG
jgi:hypothetical protein